MKFYYLKPSFLHLTKALCIVNIDGLCGRHPPDRAVQRRSLNRPTKMEAFAMNIAHAPPAPTAQVDVVTWN
ncbi:MAG: hypothetical protein ACI9BF_000095 [Candidatus Paceibacteria bacterium]|jgi:hypothetical protein